MGLVLAHHMLVPQPSLTHVRRTHTMQGTWGGGGGGRKGKEQRQKERDEDERERARDGGRRRERKEKRELYKVNIHVCTA